MRDDFDGDEIDRSRWMPHYLPAWSSREATVAEYSLGGSRLTLTIPLDHPLWCERDHPEPLRVSGLQSASMSGAVGSARGQQRFREDLVVAEEQPRFEGWLQSTGRIAVRCAMDLSPRSMAAMWLAGFEDPADDAGELCVVEVFGRSIDSGGAEIGVGVKQVNDPRLASDFAAPRVAIDVGQDHVYAAEWDVDGAAFTVDGESIRSTARAPSYPMQIMLAVFDFPAWPADGWEDHVPSLTVDWIEAFDEHPRR